MFEKAVTNFINTLVFKPETLDSLTAVLVNKYRIRQKDLALSSSSISLSISDLEAEKANLLDSFPHATTNTVREDIERKIIALEKRIEQTRTERNKIEITEDDLSSFIAYAKEIMEHPAKILLDEHNLRSQQSLFSLVFDGLPTYKEILSGTPKLTWIFNTSLRKDGVKTSMVTLRGIEPRFYP